MTASLRGSNCRRIFNEEMFINTVKFRKFLLPHVVLLSLVKAFMLTRGTPAELK